MRRREFIAGFAGAGLAHSSRARAQQRAPKPARIGIIDPTTIWDAFREELRNLGYVEGQNIIFEYRYAEGQPERLAIAAAELVRVPVDVIATYGCAAWFDGACQSRGQFVLSRRGGRWAIVE